MQQVIAHRNTKLNTMERIIVVWIADVGAMQPPVVHSPALHTLPWPQNVAGIANTTIKIIPNVTASCTVKIP